MRSRRPPIGPLSRRPSALAEQRTGPLGSCRGRGTGMSDIFVSYAREEEAAAGDVAAGLRALGYEVWRDDQLPAHRPYADVIEERLEAAKAVVVLWSAGA